MGQELTQQTYYEILDVSPGATQQQVMEAFERAKIAYAPDSPALYSMFTKEEASYLLKLIEEAYRTLGNQALRRTYDQSINIQQQGNSPNALSPVGLTQNTFDNNVTNIPSGLSGLPMHSNTAPSKGLSLSPFESDTPPKGYAQTRFGHYKLDQNMETAIEENQGYTGEFLEKIRNYKNISIDQLSRETRISRSYLHAIEAEDFNTLPALVFVRGFVSQFAKSLGLNAKIVATSYMKNFNKDPIE